MRIQFKRVRYKNILSTGNAFTTIDLDRTQSTLISGGNGAGKSTLLDAIVFGLYGKPFRKINKPQLVNTINNKDCVVEIYFTVGGSDYKIIRGLKPNIFEIYKGDVLLDQDSASRDYQGYLEQFILGINYKSFNQIVVLGSATYVPFMELPAQQRRDIIEDLLDIQVFSTMNLLVKDRLSTNKSEIKDNGYHLDMTQQKIDSAEEHNESIKKIRATEVDKIRERMKEHLETIQFKANIIDSLNDEIAELIAPISDKKSIRAKVEKAKGIQRDLEGNIRGLDSDLNFYHDNDNCPTCKQGIHHTFKDTVITEKTLKRNLVLDGIAGIKSKIEEMQARLDVISDVEDEIQERNLKVVETRGEIKISKNALTSYKKDMESAKQQVEEVGTAKLQQLNKDKSDTRVARKSLLDEQATLVVVNTILKDGGIKTKIIKQYIPVMNKLINKYLGAFDLFVDFQLDENFNEVIKSRFRDTFSYASFSEGEKLRISLAIMLAWRAVAKLRNSVSTNLLLLDETLDGALDGVGIESLIETLHSINGDDNIFVISHRGDQFAEKFASHIKFAKIKNFSEISI